VRVLHCPYNVGGQPGALARAERELGLDSRAVVFEQPSGYAADEVLRRAGVSRVEFERRRWRLLVRAVRDYDVVHFNFGRTLLPEPPTWRDPSALHRVAGSVLGLRDLPLLRRAGKRIVVTFQGDDARQGDVLRSRYERSLATELPGYYDPGGDAVKRRIVRAFDRWADRIFYLNPDLAHVLPPRAEFLPYAVVDPREWRPVEREPRSPAVVVHAPTDRAVKGTRHVVAAVERLRADGVDVELRLVEGAPHSEARELYAGATLAVDQLLLGWYGSFGVELMALGKPLVCFLRHEDLGVLPAGMRVELPVESATPDDLPEVLRGLLARPSEELAEAGRRAREFVERWHDPLRVAARLKDVYEEIAATPSRRGR
jgi:glycosyltransferase involved in cell wall biosynthesis